MPVFVGAGTSSFLKGDGGAGGTSSFAAGTPYAITATGGAGGKGIGFNNGNAKGNFKLKKFVASKLPIAE